MSNFPHSTGNPFTLSASPYGEAPSSYQSCSLAYDPVAVQSNLETLITSARSHPHARRNSVPDSPVISLNQSSPINSTIPLPAPSDARSSRRMSGYHPQGIETIAEASFDDGAAILLGDESEDPDARSERTSLLRKERWDEHRARRRSYGSTSEPVGTAKSKRRKSTGASSGNSRSRSKARSPPRKSPFLGGRMKMTSDLSDSDREDEDKLNEVDASRGRRVESRPLSPTSTRASETTSLLRPRRYSHARFADDSSGDEGGDVVRGLIGSGGGVMLGRAGLGMTPSTAGPGPSGPTSGGYGGLGLDFDPVEELDAADLQLPVAEDGKEVRVWSEALKVSWVPNEQHRRS